MVQSPFPGSEYTPNDGAASRAIEGAQDQARSPSHLAGLLREAESAAQVGAVAAISESLCG